MVDKVKILEIKDRVKKHVVENKVPYLIGSHVAVVGVTWLVLRQKPSLLGKGAAWNIPEGMTVTASIVGDNNLLDQRVIMLVERPGPPSYIIGKHGTNLEWDSMGKAAREEGLRLSDLRDHLNGKIDNLNAETYFRKGLAAAGKSQKKHAV